MSADLEKSQVALEEDTGEAKAVYRVFSGTLAKYFYVITILMSLFHLYYNTIGVIPDLRRNALHMLFVLGIGYLMYPMSKKHADKTLRFDIILSVLGIIASLYLILFENALHARNEVPILSDLLFAALAIVLVLELTRRAAGWLIPTLSLLALAYALFLGRIVGGSFYFRGVTVSRLLYRMYFAPDGLFGSITTISSTFVFLFILFAAFLLNSGAGEFLMRLSMALLGKSKGGPAKISVFASGLMGSISGSAVANTVGTGSMTIPLMKRIGLPAHIAGGVEAAASTGGQIMPPIMGAGAFIMAQWTQIPYYTIVLVSFVPAVMYFLSVAFFVHVKAYEYDLPIMESKDIPRLRDVIKEGYHFIIPLLVLMGLLLYGYTPTYAASVGILSILLASFLNKKSRMSFRDILDSLSLGAKNSISTAIILICAGIVVGVVNLTGVGITFSMMIMEAWLSFISHCSGGLRIFDFRHGPARYRFLHHVSRAGRARFAISGCAAFGRAHDHLLVFAGCQCNAAGLPGRLCRCGYRRLQADEDGLCRLEPGQRSVHHSLAVRLFQTAHRYAA